MRVERASYSYAAAEAARLELDLHAALPGMVDFGAQARALFATDASNYRQVPIGLVTPRAIDDVVTAIAVCRKHDAPVLPRGGGTSLAGQTCNVAVVVDFSRHLTAIRSLDPAARRAVVEPGCILDSLRDAAEHHRLTFGPDPATHDHNTIGGMIGNDSCGVHSIVAGRTADNVERMTILTYDGLVLDVGPTSPDELQRLIAESGRRGEIYRRLVALRDRYAALIRQRFPHIPRRVSGFENLDALLPRTDFNVAKALVGTEGACVTVLDATLKLIPSPPHRALAILGFADVYAAAGSVDRVLGFGPQGLEGFDDLLFAEIERSNVDKTGLSFFPDGKGWLIAEFGGDTAAEAREKAQRLCDAAGNGSVVGDPADQLAVWTAREGALGVSAFPPGEFGAWPGWEDSAVPRKALAPYLHDLRTLFDRHGYKAALYGHFGDGLVHCRIDFDLRSEAGIANWRRFMDEAADLVVSYGGSLSGEHGDGEARAALLERMYGPELVECFREFKAIWDPGNRMNPGKAIDPFPMTANLRLGPEFELPRLDTHFAYPDDHGSFARATVRCVGVGKCRRLAPDGGVMCPSYQATLEEKHTTRGRARLLFEMVRGETISDGWQSEAVRDALSLCLACKGCKRDCPVGVDMATYKAEFHAHHYRGRLRPPEQYAMGLLPTWARIAVYAPGLANAVAALPPVKRLAGIDPAATLPRFAKSTFRQWFANHRCAGGGERVVLWPDTFCNHFRPQTAIAATRVLEAAGCEVVIPQRPLCCGRTLYDPGFLDRAKSLWRKTLECLADEIARGTPIVILEPACASAFKDELVNLFPDDSAARKLSGLATYFDDFVAQRRGAVAAPRRGGRALVQTHCHQHAVLGTGAQDQLLDWLDLKVERPPQGCCGMAGAFGFARATAGLARAIGERALLPAVRAAEDETIIIASGFSCREQIERGSGRQALHLAEVLGDRLGLSEEW
jgi:FAD/FMN-containing dehydrogenase/Fe-S oxidoreductase